MSEGPPQTTQGEIARIDTRLGSLRGMIRSSAALRGGAIVALACVGIALLSLIVDRTFRLSVAWRAVALLVYGAGLLYVAWRYLVCPLRQRLSGSVLAEFLEGHFPEFRDALRSAVDFAREDDVAADRRAGGGEALGGQPAEREAGERREDPEATRRLEIAMKRHVIRDAGELLRAAPVESAIDVSRVATALAGGVLGVVAAAVLALVFGYETRLWFRRNLLLSGDDWPYRTVLVVEGFDATSRVRGVPRGDPLLVRVLAMKTVPDRVRIRLRYEQEWRRFNLAREGEAAFVYEHPEVAEPFEFTVEGGDYRSPPYRVVVLERPEVEALHLSLEYPAYTRMEGRRLSGDVGEVSAPEGTTLRLEGLATKRLAAAWIETEEKQIPLRVSSDEPRHFSGSYVPERGGMVTVHLKDEEGVPPDRWMRFLVTPTRDRIPTVAARSEGIGSMIVPEARIPLAIKASDDFGLTCLGAEYEIRVEAEEPLGGDGPFETFDPRTPVELETGWEVRDVGIAPGRRLDLKVYAVDNDGFREPKRGYAPTQSFLVVTPERLLEEFLRREEEQRRILERAIEEQRGLRDVTYRYIDEVWRKEGGLPAEVVQDMVRMSRAERQLGRQMASISDAMRLILDEMRNNRIAEANETERLAATIIGPLADLAERSLPDAAVRLNFLRELARAEERTQEGLALAAEMEQILSAMNAIVQSMRRIEGFTEVVNRLRAIMRIHSESAAEAARIYQREIEKIFEDVPPEDAAPGAEALEDE